MDWVDEWFIEDECFAFVIIFQTLNFLRLTQFVFRFYKMRHSKNANHDMAMDC